MKLSRLLQQLMRRKNLLAGEQSRRQGDLAGSQTLTPEKRCLFVTRHLVG